MAQKYAIASGSSSTSRFTQDSARSAVCQLSDGTAVFVYWDGSAYQLAYSSDHATVTAISSVAVGAGSDGGALDVCRDASDNIYVVYSVGAVNSFAVRAFTKGSGYTWTAQTALTITPGSSSQNPSGLVAVWAATSGAGHLVVLMQDNFLSRVVTLNVAVALAGSGTALVDNLAIRNQSSHLATNYDLDGNGFGATNLLMALYTSLTSFSVWALSVSSTGAVTSTASASTITTGNLTGLTRVRVIRYSTGKYAVVYPSATSNHYAVAVFDGSGSLLIGGTDCGTPTNMPLRAASQGWDVYLDPITANQLWVLAPATTISGGSQVVYRLRAALGASTVTWDTAATVDDTLTGLAAASGDVRAVTKPTVGAVDWQVFAQTAATPTYALLGSYSKFNLAPNAPTLTNPANNAPLDLTATNRFTWTFSDPDTGDSQSGFDLQYRTGGGAWTTVSGTTPNQYVDLAAGTFTAATWEWQVRTYDALGTVGPWSASSFFPAATPPSTPSITAPTSGSTISLSTAAVTWSAPSQTDYQVRRVADNAGSADTGTVYSDTGDVVDATSRSRSISFDTTGRYEHVQVRIKASGLWSAWADVRVLVSYTPPVAPTLVLTPDLVHGLLTVAITNPTPTGGQPAVSYNNVYVNDGSGEERRATGLAANATWTYYTPISGRDYTGNVRVVAVGTNGTTASSS